MPPRYIGTEKKRRLLSMVRSAYLNEDLMVEIMSRVPAKSIVRFKSVSKRWKSIVEDPTFIALHHKQSHSRPDGGSLMISIPMLHLDGYDLRLFSAPYQGGPACPLLQNRPELKEYKASPSTHSLILLYPYFRYITDKPVFVFNPTTRELIQLPPLENTEEKLQKMRREYPGFKIYILVHYSLGFDPLTGVYKVLSLFSFDRYIPNQSPPEKAGCCNMYNVLTLGTKEWRKLDNTPKLPVYKSATYSSCVNGVIYFKANPDHDFIVAFDVGEEKFRLVSPPQSAPPMYKFMEFGGQLALRENTNVVWVLEDDKQEKWICKKLQWVCGENQYDIFGGAELSNTFLVAPQYKMVGHRLWVCYWDTSRKDWSWFLITGLPDINYTLTQEFLTNNIETLFSPSTDLRTFYE